MNTVNPNIEESWKMVLQAEFQSAYFISLKNFLLEEKKNGKRIFPAGKDIFAAFNHTPFDQVNVVILGQDPYHGPGQANGLCFSVQDGVRPPPSLQNIYKEINADLGIPIPTSGNLSRWADQGVLLLNATLTVEEHKAGSHQNQGWEKFTDTVIRILSEQKQGLVFILWGNYAKAKISLIDSQRHHVLQAAHPSPFSAYHGFFGCKHFSKTNALLKEQGKSEIKW